MRKIRRVAADVITRRSPDMAAQTHRGHVLPRLSPFMFGGEGEMLRVLDDVVPITGTYSSVSSRAGWTFWHRKSPSKLSWRHRRRPPTRRRCDEVAAQARRHNPSSHCGAVRRDRPCSTPRINLRIEYFLARSRHRPGLTELCPFPTAHLLLGERLLAFEDPDHVFAVMIQLGSILAIVWLYRVKIVTVIAGLPSDPDARRFAAAVIVAVVPALVVGGLFSTFVKSVLYESPAVFATSFIVGGAVMLVVERVRPAPTVLNAERTPLGRAFGVGLCQMRASFRRVAQGATMSAAC